MSFYFAKKKPGRTLIGFQVPPLFGSISGLDIPAGEKEYTLTSSFTTPVDIDVIGVGAHMQELNRFASCASSSKHASEYNRQISIPNLSGCLHV